MEKSYISHSIKCIYNGNTLYKKKETEAENKVAEEIVAKS